MHTRRIVFIAAAAVTASLAPVTAKADTTAVERVVTLGAATDGSTRLAAGGVVMQTISIGDDATDHALLLPDGVRAGRFQTLYPAHPSHSVPKCWHGTDDDFAELDAQVAESVAAGIDPASSQLVLTYLSSCSVVPGDADDDAMVGLLPSMAAAAVLTNPDAVEAQLLDQIRHATSVWGMREFVVWNEPDGLNPLPPDLYLRYWDLVHAALRTVEDELGIDLQIGGPADSNFFTSRVYVPALLDHVIAERQSIDHVVLHRYGDTDRTPSSDKTRQQIHDLQAMIDDRAAAAEAAGVTWPPAVQLNEWTWVAAATNDNDVARTAVGAAYDVVQLAVLDSEHASGHYFAAQDSKEPPSRCVDPCEGSTPDMIGYGLLDGDNRPRPAYHIFEWFHRLGPMAVDATPTDDVIGSMATMGALAGQDDRGVVRMLLANHDPDGEGIVVRVVLDLGGRPMPFAWATETITGDQVTGDTPLVAVGRGVPSIELPPNTTMLLTLSPAGPTDVERGAHRGGPPADG
jgi:hypothetical protein